MNEFLHYLIEEIVHKYSGIKAVLLKGSKLKVVETDFWSDTDLLVVLEPDLDINEEIIKDTIGAIGSVIGSEVLIDTDSIVYRTVIDTAHSIELLDITFCTYTRWLTKESCSSVQSTLIYGDILIDKTKVAISEEYSVQYTLGYIESVWFKYFITIKKFARHDHLIGMHLLLDLIKEYLVIEMVERDIAHKTNIHRYGGNEKLPDGLKLSIIDESNIKGICDYIKTLAYEYDMKLQKHIINYRSRYDKVAFYIEETKIRVI